MPDKIQRIADRHLTDSPAAGLGMSCATSCAARWYAFHGLAAAAAAARVLNGRGLLLRVIGVGRRLSH